MARDFKVRPTFNGANLLAAGDTVTSVGNVANNAADSGNPVKVGGVYNAVPPDASANPGNRLDIQVGTRGSLKVQMHLLDAIAAITGNTAVLADGTSNAFPTALDVRAWEYLFNGTTWDRRRALEAFKTASATPDVGLTAVGLAERRFTSVNLGTAANSVQAFDCEGAAEASFFIGTTQTGTFTFEVSADGTNYYAAEVWLGTVNRQVSGQNLTPTANDVYRIGCAGMRSIRIRTVTTLGAVVAVTTTLSPFTAMPIRQATGQGRTLLFAQVNATTTGDNTLVAAVTGMKIKLVSYVLVADASVTARFASGAGSTTPLSGAMILAASGGVAIAGQPSAHLMETAAGALLNLVNGGGNIRGHLSYFLEP